MNPSLTTLGLTLLASLSLLSVFLLGLLQRRRGGVSQAPGKLWRGLLILLMTLAIVLLAGIWIWRAVEGGNWTVLIADPFDAFLALALLLLSLAGYFHWTRHLRSLGYLSLPMVVLVVWGALLFGLRTERSAPVEHPWTLVHLLSVLLGSACLTLGGVGGLLYLWVDHRLRHRRLAQGWLGLPPLASLERLIQRLTLMGFPLLTLGLVSGFFRTLAHPRAMGSMAWPKVILALSAWVIYAAILHVRLAPSFRGSRAAWMSLVGLGLLVGVYLAAAWMPVV